MKFFIDHNPNHRSNVSVGLIIGFICIITIAVVALLFGFNQYVQSLVDKEIPAAQPLGSTNVASSSIEIKNLGQVQEQLALVQNSPFHKVELNNLYQTTYNGHTLIVGEQINYYGNGVGETYKPPVIIADGILYHANDIESQFYPLEEVNWKTLHKSRSISGFVPFEKDLSFIVAMQKSDESKYSPTEAEYLQTQNNEEAIFSKKFLNIGSMTLEYTKSGGLTAMNLSEASGKDVNAITTFKKIPNMTIYVNQSNKDTIDYDTQARQSRPKPGFASGQNIFYSEYGFKVNYPKFINGTSVKMYSDSDPNTRVAVTSTFFIDGENKGYGVETENYMRIYCSDFQETQIGPKIGEPYFIATSTRSNLKNWGISNDPYADIASFTSEYAHCSVSASGKFRLNMLLIELE
ncbi:MAG: hypothetical protein V4519_01755 [Patescibacteria group bacterium]